MSRNRLNINQQLRFKKRFEGNYIYLNELVHNGINEQSYSDLRYWYNFNKKINKCLDYAEENEIDLEYQDSGWYYKD